MSGAESQTHLETDKRASEKAARLQRSCVGGSGLFHKSELLRFVKGPDGMVWFDLYNKAPGRGAYLAPNKKALEQAVKRKAFSRHLEAKVSDDLQEKVLEGLAQKAEKELHIAKRANGLLTGTDKVIEAMKSNNISLVLVASDASGATQEKISYSCSKAKIESVIFADKSLLSALTQRDNCTVLGLKKDYITVSAKKTLMWYSSLK